MTTPTRTEVLDHVAAHFGMSRIAVLELFKTPTHPYDMRDSFALAAIAGTRAANPNDAALIANRAYMLADAMLAARVK